jgi:hypothetical protein
VDERALAYAAAAAGGGGRLPLGAIVGFDEDGAPVFDMDYCSGEDSDFDSEEGEEEGSESFDSEDEGDSDEEEGGRNAARTHECLPVYEPGGGGFGQSKHQICSASADQAGLPGCSQTTRRLSWAASPAAAARTSASRRST